MSRGESYIFSSMEEQSDIDVTLISNAIAGCQFERDVRGDCGISDHDVILIRMMYGESEEEGSSESKGWIFKNVNWEKYENDLSAVARNVDSMADIIMDCIQETNGKHIRMFQRHDGRKVE